MNTILIPFFLGAQVVLDSNWEHGPEYTFEVIVNSTALAEEESSGSVRLNVASKLICQVKPQHTISCHFEDSRADSFVAESRDPGLPAPPMDQASRQKAYEIGKDQFEMKFSKNGLETIIVRENIQPQELDMIRVIVGQLNIGPIVGENNRSTFEKMENFTQGECMTSFKVDRKTVSRALYVKRNYALTGDKGSFNLKSGQLLGIKKMRNLTVCTHKIPYFFGSAESFRQVSDVSANFSSSSSHILITSTEFISETTNVITTSKASDEMVTTLHENISLRLSSIQAAKSKPPEVKDAESASIFIGKWSMENSTEANDSI